MTDISHDSGDEESGRTVTTDIMALVKGPSWEDDDYYGINVIFRRGGKVEFSTYDSMADKELARYKEHIVQAALDELKKDPETVEELRRLGHSV